MSLPFIPIREIKKIMAQSVNKTAELKDKTVFGGAIDEFKAIKMACESILLDARLKISRCAR